MRVFHGITLDGFQEEAFDIIDRHESVFIAAPTGAGKTIIADYAIDKAIKAGKGVVYTAPVKALSNQKYRDFRRTHGEANVGILTGDVSINPQAPIMVMTTEIFRNVELTEPERLKGIDWIIFDEVHYLDDEERGTVWEESIMLKPQHMRILALSATVPNVDDLASWISTLHSEPVRVIKESTRPVPLKFFFQCDNRYFDSLESLGASGLIVDDDSRLRKMRFRDPKAIARHSPNRVDALFDHLQKQDKLPVIYFSFSRKRCELLANELAKFAFLSPAESEAIRNEYRSLLHVFGIENDKTALYLEDMISRGIAYHHAGLLPTLKEVIERLFSAKMLKAIFTTETFALGVNMPARSVVFDEVRKFYGAAGHANLKTRDFYQMAGRAGRRGLDTAGNVFIRVNPMYHAESELRRIIFGKSEPVLSQFSSNYATIMNLYKQMGEKILDIYPQSFHFHQSGKRDREAARYHLKQKIRLLKDMEYILGDGTLSLKGDIASRTYSYELHVGEMYQQGYFDGLKPRDLAIVVCAMVYEPRKGIIPPPVPAEVKDFKRGLDTIVRGINYAEKRYDIFPFSKQFAFHLSRLMADWYDGATFDQIMQDVDFDDGEVVRYFRMTVQTLRELMTFEAFSEEFRARLREALRTIDRDTIDAEKQLRQEI